VSKNPVLRALRALALGLLGALAGFGVASSPGCGTDARGITDCRDIERARCSAAAPCGIVTDVEECQRFYRDHCLHGLAVAPPPPDEVNACIQAITTAGDCARTEGKDASIAECPNGDRLRGGSAMTACDVVLFPERTAACAFLTPNPSDAGEAGAGGVASK